MKKSVARLLGLALTMLLPTSVLAFNNIMDDVNTSCGYTVVADCVDCHDPSDYALPTVSKDLYLTDGACGFCPESPTCTSAPPTMDQLLVDAQDTTRAYFERLFSEFMYYLNVVAGGDFAEVFQYCPQIAPEIASDFSRQNGYLVRRVTEKTRNSRNIPDDWELLQLRKFAKMAADGEPRTPFEVTKPDGTTLTTREYEVFEVVEEPAAKGKDKKVAGEPRAYFRYMRSITMPPHPADTTADPNPGLPCLLCHGSTGATPPEVSPEVAAKITEFYPHDQAMGYVKGDIRGAWTIKIPLSALPE